MLVSFCSAVNTDEKSFSQVWYSVIVIIIIMIMIMIIIIIIIIRNLYSTKTINDIQKRFT